MAVDRDYLAISSPKATQNITGYIQPGPIEINEPKLDTAADFSSSTLE